MLAASKKRRNGDEVAPSSVEEDKARRRKSMAEERKRRRSTMLPGRLDSEDGSEQTSAAGSASNAQATVSKLLSSEEMARRFEEWMKIAADNKINAANSWNLALIDYFYDMNILREGDSINFQKASCTLDGCVKIYTSRVDSVATETGKLLSGLADSKADNDGYDRDGEDGDETAPKKKMSRTVKTLLEDFTSLNTKKFDLDFTVDPLFKKTCADFDEGGARGLLLNHLSISKQGMIIFDAGDAVPSEDDDMETIVDETEESPIDIQKLLDKMVMRGQDIHQRRICPSLEHFSFESTGTDNVLQAAAAAFESRGDEDLQEEFELDPGLLGNDDIDYARSDDGGGEEGEERVNDYGPMDDGGSYGEDETEMAWTDAALTAPLFDEKALRNWAGPEHWRLRPIKAPTKSADAEARRKERKEFTIDFLDASPTDVASLFAPASSIPTLPRETNRKPSDRHLLPQDLKFTGADLFSLFLRPQVKLGANGRQQIAVPRRRDRFAPDFGGATGAEDSTFTAGVDSSSYFFNDAADDEDFGGDDGIDIQDDISPDFDLGGNAAEEGAADVKENYGDDLVAQPKTTNRIQITYAKTAKRVDVKKLKDNIWTALTQPPDGQLAANEPTLSSTINAMRPLYPDRKLKDISVAFCFICILHLANERDLRIEDDGNLSDLRIYNVA